MPNEFQDAQPYHSKESIMIGDGLCLKITHVGTVKLPLSEGFVTLDNVYSSTSQSHRDDSIAIKNRSLEAGNIHSLYF